MKLNKHVLRDRGPPISIADNRRNQLLREPIATANWPKRMVRDLAIAVQTKRDKAVEVGY